MATPRTKESTIPAGRDPLVGVAYEQSKPIHPIHSLISDTTREAKKESATEDRAKPEPEPDEGSDKRAQKGKVTVLVDNDLLERLRNAAYWERKTLATIAEDGLRIVVERLERQHGGPFKQRSGDVKKGRPQGSRNNTGKAR